jgi:hypothetical protein
VRFAIARLTKDPVETMGKVDISEGDKIDHHCTLSLMTSEITITGPGAEP